MPSLGLAIMLSRSSGLLSGTAAVVTVWFVCTVFVSTTSVSTTLEFGSDPGSGCRPGVSALLMPIGTSLISSPAVWIGLNVAGGSSVPGCGWL